MHSTLKFYKLVVKFSVFVLCILLMIQFSCKREEDDFINSPSAKLSFSTDTIMFDTVFTKLGSVTKRFKVYNHNNKSIKISSISLAQGSLSPFRINIDGQPSTHIENFILLPKDSFYLFVEVTIDPDNQNLPFIVKDSIVFITNGNLQDIKLIAWGQNAHYFYNEMLPCDTVWTNDLPYVIFDSVGISSDCKLTIEKGVKIYSNNRSSIIVFGTLEINGTPEEPVILQGTRLEEYYKDKPGQWGGIRFLPGSKDNYIKNASIRNASIGIEVDSSSINPPTPNLVLENVRIENMSAVGIVGYTSHIECTNCLINNCCQYLFVGDLGGIYKFYHTTFVNSNCICFSQDPGLVFSNTNYINGDSSFINDIDLTIVNSIIWGNNDDEIIFVENEGSGTFQITIDHTLIKTKNTGLSDFGNIINLDPKFVAPCAYSYELDTLSPAIDAGRTDQGINQDIIGNLRDSKPDLGAFERQQ